MSVPTNIVDAAAQIMAGDIGLIEDIKIGDLVISALIGLEGSDPLEVTQKPVDEGFVMTDAAVAQSTERIFEICLANPQYTAEAAIAAALSGTMESLTQTWRDKKDELYRMKNEREIVISQSHEETIPSMLIYDIVPHYNVNENYDAFFATVYLIQVRVVKSASAGGLLDQAQESVGGL